VKLYKLTDENDQTGGIMSIESLLITKEWLYSHDACTDQVDIFAEHWPDGVIVTPESLREASKLDLGWLAYKLLPHPLFLEHERQKELILAEYVRDRRLILAEYKRQEALLWAEHKRQKAEVLIGLLCGQEAS